ncbi:MAG: hypothetical protein H0V92_09485 [Pseudonocardiales bacterium]|nr:hypothetical protein [Pseudonocardiales bacterium]
MGTASEVRPISAAQGGPRMWMYEALSRARIQETEQEARRRRMVRELTAGRRWNQLARFASRRAERARSRV